MRAKRRARKGRRAGVRNCGCTHATEVRAPIVVICSPR
jgi:hypothetical protein